MSDSSKTDRILQLGTPVIDRNKPDSRKTQDRPTGSKLLRGQLFAKEKYFHKQVPEPKIEKQAKPFKPYDLTKSPPKINKIRKIQPNEQPLQTILLQNPIDLRTLLDQNNYLPLQPFCSSLHDQRSTQEWIDQLKHKRTMQAFLLNLQDLKFEQVTLIDESFKEDLEKQKQKEKGQSNKLIKPVKVDQERGLYFWIRQNRGFKKIYRWQVIFPGQDRKRWLTKVTQACKLRSMMDSLLRYKYYIQNMPSQDIVGLQTKIQTGIIGKIEVKFSKIQLDNLFDEVNSDFVRMQNKILFDKFLLTNDSSKMFSKPLDFQPIPVKQVPEYGRLELQSKKGTKQVVVLNLGHIIKSQAKSFDQLFKQFGLASLYSSKEVLNALTLIRNQCLSLKIVEIFDTNFVTGFSKLQDFKHAQEHYIHKGMRKVLDNFPHTISQIIKTELKLTKDNKCEIFDNQKFRRFLELVQHLLKDAFTDCIKRNYYNFYNMLNSYIPDSIEIVSAGIVRNKYSFQEEKNQLFRIKKKSIPLFCIQFKINQTQDDFTFTLSPKEFKNLFFGYFQNTLKTLDNIQDLQSKFLPRYENFQIIKGKLKTPMLPSQRPVNLEVRPGIIVEDQNLWVYQLFERWKLDLQKVTEPLFNYQAKYSKYKEFLTMKIEPFLTKIEQDQTKQIKQIREEIDHHRKREKQIRGEIIEKIQIGIFDVETKEVSDYISEKYAKISHGLIKVIANRVIALTNIQLQQFSQIQAKISKQTQNIQQTSELKQYLDTSAAIQIQKIKIEINKCADIYNILEQYQFKLDPLSLQNRWKVFRQPKDTYQQIKERIEIIQKQKQKYQEEMYLEQTQYKKNFDALERYVFAFHQNSNINSHDTIVKMCDQVMYKLNIFTQLTRKFNSRQQLFGREQTDYTRLQTVIKQFTPYNTLWNVVHKWYTGINKWLNDPFQKLDAVNAEKFVEQSIRATSVVIRGFKEKNMQQIVAVGEKVKGEMDKFKPNLPLMVALRKQGMKQRHWKTISDTVGIQINPDKQGFNFQQCLNLGLIKHVDLCVDVGQRASKEYNIETMLKSMWKTWEQINFDLVPYKNITYIIRGYDQIQIILDEHLVNTQAIQFSAFKKPFEEEIIKWYNELKTMSDVMEEWMKCQGQWMYLQPIFDSADIAKQLPLQSKKFKLVDTVWKANMNLAKQHVNVLKVCITQGLLDKLKDSNQKLQQIQKELNNYLQKKRERFARFYFLSNDDLLQILSQTKEPTAVQPHLKKVFENIHSIQFDHRKHIKAMFSAEKQKINFKDIVNPNDKNVEDWMGEVQDMMRKSVREQLLTSVKKYRVTKRTLWVCNHPGQCVLNGSQIQWTTEVQQAIGMKEVSKYYQKLTFQLNDLVQLVRQPLSKQQQVTLNALIVVDVHAKDVVQKLVLANIFDIGAFQWISQLRYYWQNDDCYVKCVQTNFPYGYQYLGNTLRLVITPLTDKCYMTLMGALKLNLGGAPAGPAGTGKTQSTKDLAKALAKQCVVFNCSDSMDYIMIGKFFKGLASAGAWCCFDEFNRINIEVLSVIAQQLLILFGQKAKGSPSCEFQGSVIKILPTFSVFVTMNPGYAGRTQLPDNLKALFRSVAMMVPDYAMIGEIMLYSFGFKKGRDLAKKMVATFKLSSEQLSSQDHYDYGMRAVRSVINAAGLLKSATPDMDEDQLLLRALRDVNVPKFLKEDLPLFENIITDLFPGIERPKIDYGQLLKSVSQICKKQNLQPITPFIEKVIQLYDTIQVRHGLMVVGPTGGAKTKNFKVLSAAMTALQKKGQAKVHLHTLNPKSITMGQLYGAFNQQTHEWADGILAYMVRQCVKDQSIEKHWIIFDGPVDSLWIQSMNTVLDDNKKLCLNSGQILTLTPHMTMMFEVEDLAVASPATVSRCGMVYMEPASIGTRPLIDSWMNLFPQSFKDRKVFMATLNRLFTDYLQVSLQFLRYNCKQVVSSSNGNLTQSLMRNLDCFLQNFKETEIKKVTVQQLQHLESIIQPLFVWSFVWSICCTTDLVGRNKFDVFLRDLIKSKKISLPLPEKGTIYEYEFKQKSKEWVQWTKSFESFEIDQKLSYHEIAIPTTDSTRNLYLMKLILTHNYHILALGPTGTGKSQNAYKLLTSGLPDSYQYIALTFSAQTSANQTQDTIDTKMQKRRKGYYGPPIGKKCIIFVDDLNMPKKQTFGAQPPIQLIRQYLDHKGWYNRKDLLFMNLEELVVMGAMGPPGGGRTYITNRLVRHFNVLAYTQLPDDIVIQIFSSLLNFYLKKFPEVVRASVLPTTQACLDVFQCAKNKLLPTPSKSHYTFNLRDIWKVVQGICTAYPKPIIDTVSMVNLWYHENMRVYHDRLINQQDKQFFIEQVVIIANNRFKQDLAKQQNEEDRIYKAKRLIYGDFMAGRDLEIRNYVSIEEGDKFLEKMNQFLEQYNSQMGSKKAMKLVMFLDACQHICRIARIIRQPQGNALLLGVGGSGRQSLAKMATFISNYKISQIEVIKNYSMRNWREDIKAILLQAGLENKPLTFLFTDTQIINEQMLQDINSILNSGDVTNLYQQKDFEQIVNHCKADCAKKNLQPNKMNIFAMYLARVKRNIHNIICMSPLGQTFATRLRMFPSLVNCSTIDWFSEWPQEALLGVGKGQLIDYQTQLGLQGKLQKLVQTFKCIHKSVQKISIQFKAQLTRYNYVTPTSYLELLSMYKIILKEKQKQSVFQINRLQNGLNKLQDANVAVEEMQITLTRMQPELEKASEQTQKLMAKLTVDKASAEEVQKVVSVQKKQADQQKAEASKLASQAEASVAEANQVLQVTLAQVKKLKKQHLNEIKSLANPPLAIKVILGGIVILLQDSIKKVGGQIIIKNEQGKKTQDYFETAKKYLLNDVGSLMSSLLEYKKQSINPAFIKKLQQKILPDPDFTLERAKTCSYAIQFLYLWVKAMYDFNKVFNQTRPLREKLEATQKLLAQKSAFLKEKMDALDNVNQKIKSLQELFTQKMKQKERLTKQIEDCKVKLTRAKKLTEGLSDEQKRWSLDVKKLGQNATLIAGNSVVASGMVAYCGPFTAEYRNKLQKQWCAKLLQLDIEHKQNITMRAFLGIPVLIQGWNINGLPKDDTSTENGIIIDKTRRWPLMIDPQTQANKFIKNLGKQHEQGLQVLKVSDPNLMRTLELAVQFGKWILLQGVGKDLDPSLEPILLQKVIKTGSSFSINIGQKTLNYNTSFKFFMTTTAPNPHYPPETFVKVAIINFAITPSGLQEQMLAQIVALQNPQLQQKKLDIVIKNSQDKKSLIQIEDSILKALSSTQGNIDQFLKDQSLINELQNSKKMSQQINQRVQESKLTQKQIDQTREGYRPVAYRASLLFFCILDLSLIDPMYQYSLQWFTRLFIMGVENSTASNVLQQRLKNMNDYFTYSLYENVCRSLFQKQKLLFSFLLHVKILQGYNKMNLSEWRYLLAGPTGEIDIPENPTTWISANQWPDLYRQFYGLGKLERFKGIEDHLIKYQNEWKRIFDSPSPQSERLPSPYDRFDEFQKILIIKSIRSDKVVTSIQNYVSNNMGERFIIAPTFDLSKCYKDATITTPLIFVLSAGSDPVADFIKFAEQMGMGKKYESISLGQGQGKKAEKLIKQATTKGGWILLQNCHLAVSWMSELERLCQELTQNMNKQFRLWLTSMPTAAFPISILQNSVKMTLQPPQGLRNNLLRTYKNLDVKEFQQCKKSEEYKKLLFGFCLFHAIVQDRRKFGPIGWNIAYQFTNEDLMVCRRQLKMLLEQYDEIPYKVLNYLGAEINYGGRVTDDKDVRLITTILLTYMNPDVLKQGYKFSASGTYYQPQATSIEQYISYIESLPLNPAPEAFGLNDNAEITNSQNQTYQMLQSILSVQPKTSSSGGKSRQQIITQISQFIQTRTPQVFPIHQIQKKYPTSYEQSMNTVLVQQIIRYNRLLAVMKQNLINVKKAVKGLIVMSQQLQLISNSLFDNQVPKIWDEKGFLSMKPLASWTQDLNNRIVFLQNWIDNGTPSVFWISGFFFPQAFLTGTLQNYARKHIIAIDKLSFEFRYLDHLSHTDIKQKPMDGCYIYGMFLEGAWWDKRKHMIENPLPKELYSNLPLIHLIPKADRPVPATGIYNCPVYKVVSRRGTLSTTGHSTNFVMFFQLPTDQDEKTWIRAGVAAFLALRY